MKKIEISNKWNAQTSIEGLLNYLKREKERKEDCAEDYLFIRLEPEQTDGDFKKKKESRKLPANQTEPH